MIGAAMNLFVVDAFTDTPFAGNPAAVCLLESPADERWMQSVAAEMNLPETSFVSPDGSGLRLRWFTPSVEVDLCGHATLAAAHALWEAGRAETAAPIRFETKSGALTARRIGSAIELDFPATPATEVPVPDGLAEALGIAPRSAGRTPFDLLAVLPEEASVRSLRPDFAALRRFGVRGIIVTARSEDPRFDFVSRFFAPAVGIDEDPVTGSAHCALGPFWSERLGKTELVGRQLSARGGTVEVRIEGDRVRLRGGAVTVVRGNLVAR